MCTSATTTFKGHLKIIKIFEEHWRNFWKNNKNKFPKEMWKSIKEAVEKMLKCGSYENGYYLYRCPCSKGEIKVGFACKSRFCPRCGRIYVDNWVEKVLSKIINVPHWHLLFSIPEQFRMFFFRNRKLLKGLADLAVETILEVVTKKHKKKKKKYDLVPGIIAVIHTFGRDLKLNPHVHIVIASVAVNKKTKKKRKLSYFHYESLHKVWQYKLLNFIKKNSKGDPKIARLVDQCWEARKKGLYVNAQKPLEDARHTIRYVGRYLGRPAIAEYRIIEYDGENVTFWYKDHKSGKRETCTMPVEQFIGRLVMHIPPKNFQMVRRYGFYGRRVSEVVQEVISTLKRFVQKVFAFKEGKKSWRDRLIETFNRDPLKCPYCGDEMLLWEIWHPRYGKIYDIWDDAVYVATEKKKEIKKIEEKQEDHQLQFEFMPT